MFKKKGEYEEYLKVVEMKPITHVYYTESASFHLCFQYQYHDARNANIFR